MKIKFYFIVLLNCLIKDNKTEQMIEILNSSRHVTRINIYIYIYYLSPCYVRIMLSFINYSRS